MRIKRELSMHGNKFLFWLFILVNAYLLSAVSVFSQNIQYARKVIDTLCSPAMHGRGYVSDGDKVAAQFIADEFHRMGVKPFGWNYFQDFKIFTNTFPSEMTVILNDQELVPGREFIVRGYSGSAKGNFEVAWAKKGTITNKKNFEDFQMEEFRTKVLVVDVKDVKDSAELATLNFMKMNNTLEANAVIEVTEENFKGEAALHNIAVPIIQVKRSALPKEIKSVTLNIKNEFKDPYLTRNVIGYIEGTEKKDSFIVFTAHYDHLGHMGSQMYFPGANDNASGVAMLLNLVEYFSKNPPKYSIAFMAFSAEELGLMGSQAYTRKPLFPLKQIRFLINMDIVGTGEDGITVVNAYSCSDEFSRMIKINSEKNYLKTIMPRENANNSDHFMFTDKNVRSIFFYTMGGITAYHDIYDRPETLPLTEFEDIVRLLTDLVKTF